MTPSTPSHFPLPSLGWGTQTGTGKLGAAWRALAPGLGWERASEKQVSLGSRGVRSSAHPTAGPCSLSSRPAGPGWTVFFLPGLPFFHGFCGAQSWLQIQKERENRNEMRAQRG